jgi:phosphatidylglycerophosphate synthase
MNDFCIDHYGDNLRLKTLFNRFPSIIEISKSHGWKREYERFMPLSRFIYRPVGFLLTWVFIRLRISTETVSYISVITGIFGCICLISLEGPTRVAGISLLHFFNLLDCVDGSIARATGTENPYGCFLDSICGAFVDLVFWAILGITAFRNPNLMLWPTGFGYGTGFWLACGAATCFLFVFQMYMERAFDEILRKAWDKMGVHHHSVSGEHSSPSREAGWRTAIRIINNNLRVRESHYFLLAVMYSMGLIDLLLTVYFFYYLFHDILLLGVYTARGRKIREAHVRIRRVK